LFKVIWQNSYIQYFNELGLLIYLLLIQGFQNNCDILKISSKSLMFYELNLLYICLKDKNGYSQGHSYPFIVLKTSGFWKIFSKHYSDE